MSFTELVKYGIDKFVEVIKYIVDASRITFIKMKIAFFGVYITVFSFTYFVDFKNTADEISLVLDPQDVPLGAVETAGAVIIVLVIADLIRNLIVISILRKIFDNNTLPKTIRERTAEKLLKSL